MIVEPLKRLGKDQITYFGKLNIVVKSLQFVTITDLIKSADQCDQMI